MEHIDDRIKALQKRSLQVLPLHYRRETPPKLLPVEALCEYDTDEVHLVKNIQTVDFKKTFLYYHVIIFSQFLDRV